MYICTEYVCPFQIVLLIYSPLSDRGSLWDGLLALQSSRFSSVASLARIAVRGGARDLRSANSQVRLELIERGDIVLHMTSLVRYCETE